MSVGAATSNFTGLLGVERTPPARPAERPDPATPSDGSARSEFLKFAHMTIGERIREDILKRKGITESELQALPKDERQAIEKEIEEIIKQEMITQAEKSMQKGLLADIRV